MLDSLSSEQIDTTILHEMGCAPAQLPATSVVMISALDSDHMLGNPDKLMEEFDLCYSPEAARLHDTSMSMSSAIHSEDVLENEDRPTEDVGFWSSLVT